MKKYIYILVAFIASVFFASCGNNSTSVLSENSTAKNLERERFIADSLAKEKAVQDSLNAIVIEKCKPLFKENKDEFSNRVWVEPKNAPKYRNVNGVYCYFSTENGEPQALRFVYQYEADDWLFIREMVFNIDGENFAIAPKMETDCGNGGRIWEWCDNAVWEGESGVCGKFIEKLGNAKSVKVKLIGSKYYDTKTLTSAQIKSIKDTYDYYKALGGKFLSI